MFLVAVMMHVNLSRSSEYDVNKMEQEMVFRWHKIKQQSSGDWLKCMEDVLKTVSVSIHNVDFVRVNGIKVFILCKTVEQQFSIRCGFKSG